MLRGAGARARQRVCKVRARSRRAAKPWCAPSVVHTDVNLPGLRQHGGHGGLDARLVRDVARQEHAAALGEACHRLHFTCGCEHAAAGGREGDAQVPADAALAAACDEHDARRRRHCAACAQRSRVCARAARNARVSARVCLRAARACTDRAQRPEAAARRVTWRYVDDAVASRACRWRASPAQRQRLLTPFHDCIARAKATSSNPADTSSGQP